MMQMVSAFGRFHRRRTYLHSLKSQNTKKPIASLLSWCSVPLKKSYSNFCKLFNKVVHYSSNCSLTTRYQKRIYIFPTLTIPSGVKNNKVPTELYSKMLYGQVSKLSTFLIDAMLTEQAQEPIWTLISQDFYYSRKELYLN